MVYGFFALFQTHFENKIKQNNITQNKNFGNTRVYLHPHDYGERIGLMEAEILARVGASERGLKRHSGCPLQPPMLLPLLLRKRAPAATCFVSISLLPPPYSRSSRVFPGRRFGIVVDEVCPSLPILLLLPTWGQGDGGFF